VTRHKKTELKDLCARSKSNNRIGKTDMGIPKHSRKTLQQRAKIAVSARLFSAIFVVMKMVRKN